MQFWGLIRRKLRTYSLPTGLNVITYAPRALNGGNSTVARFGG